MRASPAAAGLVALLLLGGCTSSPAAPRDEPGAGSPPAATRAPDPGIEQYAALGDSYTAAPFVPVTDLAGGCLRSDGNYPRLLAEALGATVTDVSCGGATTRDLSSGQAVGGGRGRVPAQLRAVRSGTDLVTVGIGGNDGALFARLASACIGSDRQPLPRCGALGGALRDATQVVDETGRRVAAVLREARSVAPGALVALVGYPRLVDPAHSCPALPLSAADRAAVARLERSLDTALRRAAQAAGAHFVDVHAASRGHEICSEDPWVNGGRTDPQRALAFHPFAVEQEAVADAVAGLVAEER